MAVNLGAITLTNGVPAAVSVGSSITALRVINNTNAALEVRCGPNYSFPVNPNANALITGLPTTPNFTSWIVVTPTFAAAPMGTTANLTSYTGDEAGVWSTQAGPPQPIASAQPPLPLNARLPLNAKDFGAAVDGVTDDTHALLCMLAAAGLSGSRCRIPTGTLCISSLVQIGNGSSSGASTINGVEVWGDGMFNTTIKWIGTAGGQMLQVAGPCSGIALGDLTIDGAGSAGIGLELTSAQYAQFGDMRIRNTTIACLKLDTQASGAGTINTIGLEFGKLKLEPSAGTVSQQSHGLWLDGTAAASADSNNNVFPNVHVTAQATYQTALRLGFCDFNVFEMVNCFAAAGTGQISVLLDGTVKSGFPKNNLFAHLNCGFNPTVQGSLGNNLVLHYDTTDGASAVPSGTGLFGLADNPNGGLVQVPFGPGAPAGTQGEVLNQQITTTAATNVIVLSTAVDGLYLALLYIRVTVAATTVTAFAFTGDETGTQSVAFEGTTGTTALTVLNAVSLAVGSFWCVPIPLRFLGGAVQKPTIQITAGTANQVFVSAAILKVG